MFAPECELLQPWIPKPTWVAAVGICLLRFLVNLPFSFVLIRVGMFFARADDMVSFLTSTAAIPSVCFAELVSFVLGGLLLAAALPTTFKRAAAVQLGEYLVGILIWMIPLAVYFLVLRPSPGRAF